MTCNCTSDDVVFQLDNTEHAEPKMFCNKCGIEVIRVDENYVHKYTPPPM
jgi:hypothetical protein